MMIIGIITSASGLVIGGREVFGDWDKKINPLSIPLMVCLAVVGLILIGVDGYQQFKQEDDNQKTISNQIEAMSCNQLHDALLHNTINRTSHIQRATERYVAGCETK